MFILFIDVSLIYYILYYAIYVYYKVSIYLLKIVCMRKYSVYYLTCYDASYLGINIHLYV